MAREEGGWKDRCFVIEKSTLPRNCPMAYGKNRFEFLYFHRLVVLQFNRNECFAPRNISFLPFHRTNENIPPPLLFLFSSLFLPLSTQQNANVEDCCTIRYRFIDLNINIITRDEHTPRDFLSQVLIHSFEFRSAWRSFDQK